MKIENERILLNELDENLRALMIVPSYKLGAYTFNVETRELSFNGEATKLTRKETYLFVLFAANANSMLDRKYMLTTIWKDDNYTTLEAWMFIFVNCVNFLAKTLISQSSISTVKDIELLLANTKSKYN